MKWIVGDNGNRHGGLLSALSPEEAFLVLDESLYGDGAKPQAIQLPDTPARFDISPSVDVFDDWKIYLISCEDRDWILYRRLSDRRASLRYVGWCLRWRCKCKL